MHTDSTLMLLPTEVRLKILRNLLKHNTNIRTLKQTVPRHDHGRRQQFQENTQSSAQLLACCQKLFREGLEVLYNENTLNIVCRRLHDKYNPFNPLYWCMILDGRTPLPDTPNCFDNDVEDLLEVAQHADTILGKHARQASVICAQQKIDRLVQKFAIIQNFRHLAINLHNDDQQTHFMTYRVLRSLVRGKRVYLIGALPEHLEIPRWLWECESLVSASTSGALIEEQKTNKKSVKDTFNLWKRFTDLLEDGDVDEYSLGLDEGFRDFREAALTFDYHTALGLLDAVVKLVKIKLAQNIVRAEENIEDKAAELKEVQEIYDLAKQELMETHENVVAMHERMDLFRNDMHGQQEE